MSIEAEKQEPVARFNWNEAKFEWLTKYSYEKHHMKPLYLAPPKREIEQAHTDHPARHWDKTCPACVEQAEEKDADEWYENALWGEKQEPVAYIDAVDRKTVYVSPQRKRWLSEREDKEWRQFHYDHQYDTPLYTAPPKREWIGLTDEEEIELDEKYGDDINAYIDARDAKLKEKNT